MGKNDCEPSRIEQERFRAVLGVRPVVPPPVCRHDDGGVQVHKEGQGARLAKRVVVPRVHHGLDQYLIS